MNSEFQVSEFQVDNDDDDNDDDDSAVICLKAKCQKLLSRCDPRNAQFVGFTSSWVAYWQIRLKACATDEEVKNLNLTKNYKMQI